MNRNILFGMLIDLSKAGIKLFLIIPSYLLEGILNLGAGDNHYSFTEDLLNW